MEMCGGVGVWCSWGGRTWVLLIPDLHCSEKPAFRSATEELVLFLLLAIVVSGKVLVVLG